MEDSSIGFGSPELTATVVPHGAELVSLRTAAGAELLWDAGPEWRRHAPVLFPIIGRVPGDEIHHDGGDFALPQHGFARDREFIVDSVSEAGARLVLDSDAQTRQRFPFDFRLEISYEVRGPVLAISQTVTNTDDETWGASIGNHPAFVLPLPGADGAAHSLVLDDAESEGFARAPENLVLPERHPVPFEPDGRTIVVRDEYFADGVMILAHPRRRRVRYSAGPASVAVELDTGDFPVLGIWKPVGAPFLCLEPWSTTPTPLGWDGDIVDKPGQFLLEPGAARSFAYSLTVTAP